MDGNLHPTNGAGEVTAQLIEVTIPEAEVIDVKGKRSEAGPRIRITLDARLGAEAVAIMGLIGATVRVELISTQSTFNFETPGPTSDNGASDDLGSEHAN